MATTRDLLNISSLFTIQLLAGENGLSRIVTWPYVVLSWPISSWVSGGEILIYYGANMQYDNIALIEMLKAANENNSAGIILLTGDRYILKENLTEELLALADNLAIPLFALPSTACINSITKDIINLIQHQDKKVTAASDFWYSIFFETGDEISDLLYNKALFLGYNPKESYRVYIIKFTNLDEYLKNIDLTNSMNHPSELLRMINDKIVYHLNHMLSLEYWYCLHQRVSIFVMPVSFQNDLKIDAAILNIFEILKMQYPNAFFQTGKGQIASSLFDIKISFLQAVRSITIATFSEFSNQPIIDYEQLGIYRIFFNLNNEDILKKYVSRYLTPLHTYDNTNYTDLYRTLIAYLESNCNQAQTSKKLFLHRNTIPPRLEKIESLVGISFSNNNDIYNIRTALFAEQFLFCDF